MPKKGENISLTSYDDLFETDESRAESQLERVQNIPIRELIPFKNHPFKVLDDEAMLRTTESIAEYGVLTPLIARPLDNGGYEIISGHRRAHAAELAGLSEVPVLVRDMDDDAATVLMVDSNLQRENILPSERAFAYKMKLEAMKHQGERSDLTSCQIGTKLRTDKILAQDADESARTIQRYIRLTYLVPALLDMVDNGKPGFAAAVDLSFLGQDEQTALLEVMEQEHIKAPNGAQAKALRKASADSPNGLTAEDILQVLRPVPSQVSPKSKTISVSRDELAGYMPATVTTDAEARAYIKQALAYWKETHQGDRHDI